MDRCCWVRGYYLSMTDIEEYLLSLWPLLHSDEGTVLGGLGEGSWIRHRPTLASMLIRNN